MLKQHSAQIETTQNQMKKILLLLTLLTIQISVFGQTKDPELFPVNDRKVGYLGYYLEDGTKVVEPQFCSATYNTNGYYIVSKAEHEYTEYGERKEKHIPGTEKFGLLNSKGKFIINFDNDYSSIIVSNGVIEVYKNRLVGVVNDKNEITIPIAYEDLTPINSSLIIATKDKMAGIINSNNKVIVPFNYDVIWVGIFEKTDSPTFRVKQGEKYGVINQKGKFIIALNNNKILYLTPSSMIIDKDEKFGLLDYQSKVILPFKSYDYVEYFGENEIKFIKDNEEYIYDTKGKFLRKVKIEFMEKSPSY